jgi:hypothetical protein
VDESSDEPGGVETLTRQAAQTAGLSVAVDTPTINEGDEGRVSIGRLCTDTNADPNVAVVVDWGDGTVDPPITLTVGVEDTTGAVCPSAGQFVVCDASGVVGAPCAPLTHTYADNGPAADSSQWTITVTTANPPGSPQTSSQTETITVNNLPPVIVAGRSGAPFEGRDGDFEALVDDPGLLATEIASISYSWAPDTQTEDDTTVTIDCVANPGGSPICTETTGADQTLVRKYLDDGSYTFTVTVTDKDGASATETVTSVIDNAAPTNLSFNVNNTTASADPGARTPLVEGRTYPLAGTASDPGIDQLDITWDFGVAGQTLAGTAEITKASYPALVSFNPASILQPSFTWDDDDDAVTKPYDVVLNVSDDDGGSSNTTRYIEIVDVDPNITDFNVDDSTISEAEVATFSVTAESGADDESFDPIDPNGYSWFIGTSAGNATNPVGDVPGLYVVESGCGSSDTTCAIRFVDADDPSPTYFVAVEVSDEDSETLSVERQVTVSNVLPTLSNASVAPVAIDEAGSVQLDASVFDPADGLDADYTLFIDWGDGDTDTQTLTANGPFPSTTHTYGDDDDCSFNNVTGLCQVTAYVCESSFAPPIGVQPAAPCSPTSTFTVNINNLAPTVAIAAPADGAQLVEGVAFDLDGAFDDAAQSDDDNFSFAWTGVGAAPVAGTAAWVDRATAVDAVGAGQYDDVPAAGSARTVTLTVEDDAADATAASVGVFVRDNVPVVSITSATLDQQDEPATPTVVLAFNAETDADLLSSLNIDWGDGSDFSTTVDVINVGVAGGTTTITKGTPYADSGTYTITAVVTDEDSDSAPATASVTVDNVAPVIDQVLSTPPDPIIVAEGQSISFRVDVSDVSTVDAADLTIEFDWGDATSDTVPTSNLTPNSARATTNHVYNSPGTYDVDITVRDPDGGSSTTSRTVEVLNRAPSISDVFDTSPVGENTQVTVVSLVENPGGDVLTYSVNFNCTAASVGSIGDADFGEPRPGTASTAVAKTTYTDNGSYTVCTRVCDDDAQANSCSYGLTVVQVDNTAPVFTSFSSPAPVEEQAGGANVTLTAVAVDASPDDTVEYDFDCTDDGVVDFTNTTGTATGCTYANDGTYTARVTARDEDGGSTTRTAVVRVTNVAPTIGSVVATDAREGDANVITVTASDQGGDALTYEIDVDDDGTYDLRNNSGTFNYTYRTDGNKTFRVRVCDTAGSCAQNPSNQALVTNAAPFDVAVTVASTVTRGAPINFSATASDPGNDALSYTFEIATAGGTPVQTIGPQVDGFGTLTLNDPGEYTVTVTVSDEANAPNTVLTGTASATFTVTDVNVLVSAGAVPSAPNEGQTTTITVSPQGSAPYAVDFDLNGDGDFNDPEDFNVASCDGTSGSPCSATATYPNNRPNDAPVRVTVVVTDNDGNIASTTVNVTVRNVAPTLNPVTVGGGAIEEGNAFTTSLTANDPGTQDTLTYQLVSGPAGATVVTNNATSPATATVSWTPTFEQAGPNPFVVAVIDSDGARDEESFTVVAVATDVNANNVPDTLERQLNNGQLLPPNAGTTDSDGDGEFDLDEVLNGTNPNVSDAPAAPVPLSPVNDVVDALRPTLRVVNTTSPRGLDLTYTFVVLDAQANTVTTIAGVPQGRGNITETIVDVDLTEDTDYAWYAFANDGLADGDQSDSAEFLVDASNVAPPAPDALTPMDASVFTAGSLPTLELRAVVDPDADPVSYIFEIASDDQFANIEITSNTRSAPFYTTPEPLPQGTYYWRGKATDGTNESDYGSVSSFVIEAAAEVDVNTPPTAPSIVSPDGEVIEDTSVTLTIGAGTDADGDTLQYVFELADNAAFAGAQTSGPGPQLTADFSGLSENTTYYWRARSFDGQAASDWVNAAFEVNATNEPPTGFALLSPSNGALLSERPSAFTASEATDPEGDALTYAVVFSLNEDLSEPEYEGNGTVSGGVVSFTPSDSELELFAGDKVYWQATVSDGTNTVSADGFFELYREPVIPPANDDSGCCSTVDQRGADGRELLGAVLLLGLIGFRRRRR